MFQVQRPIDLVADRVPLQDFYNKASAELPNLFEKLDSLVKTPLGFWCVARDLLRGLV